VAESRPTDGEVKLNENLRNLLVILVIAGLVVVIPGGGTAAAVATQAVSLCFLAAVAFVASRLYREHRLTLYSLDDRRRAIFYVAIAVVVLTFSASSRLFATGPGTVAWLLLVAGAAFTVFSVFRSSRQY
jgi:hypothetical protein